VIRFAPALPLPLLLLAACGREQAQDNQAAPPPAPPAPEGDVAAAERLVRQRIGATDAVRFSGATRSASGGVPIVCGIFEQGGVRHRYIVVDRDQAFVEPRMRAGEMDRAVAEFCREGGDDAARPPLPDPGEKG